MKHVFALLASATLLTVAHAQQVPDLDPDVLAQRIIADIEPLGQKQTGVDEMLCEANLNALATDVYYLDMPKARARLVQYFGSKEDAAAEIEAHGTPTYEAVMQDYRLMLQAYGR